MTCAKEALTPISGSKNLNLLKKRWVLSYKGAETPASKIQDRGWVTPAPKCQTDRLPGTKREAAAPPAFLPLQPWGVSQPSPWVSSLYFGAVSGWASAPSQREDGSLSAFPGPHSGGTNQQGVPSSPLLESLKRPNPLLFCTKLCVSTEVWRVFGRAGGVGKLWSEQGRDVQEEAAGPDESG